MLTLAKNKTYEVIQRSGQIFGLDAVYFVKSTFWTGLRQMMLAILGLITTTVLARFTTTETFGNYLLTLSILSVFGIATFPGLEVALSRSAALGFDQTFFSVIRFVLKMGMFVIPIVVIAGIALNVLGYQIPALGLLIAAPFFPLFIRDGLWEQFLLAKERFRNASLAGTLKNLFITSSLVGAAIFSKGNFAAIIITYVLASSVVNVGGVVYAHSFIQNKKEDPSCIPYGKYLTLIGILTQLSTVADKIVLGLFISPEILAQYVISITIVLNLQAAVRSISVVANAKIARIDSLPVKHWIMLLIGGGLVSILLFLIIDQVILLLFSESFQEASDLARITAFAFIFFPASVMLNKFMIMHKNTYVLTRLNIFKPLILWTLQIALFFVWGLKGLVVAFSLMPLVQIILILICNQSLLPTGKSFSGNSSS